MIKLPLNPRDKHPVDAFAGRRVRSIRESRGISQDALAKGSNITFQQVQKYERGENRMSAGRLWEFSKTLEVEIGEFFKGFEEEEGCEESLKRKIDVLSDKQTIKLVQIYQKLPKEERKYLYRLAGKMIATPK